LVLKLASPSSTFGYALGRHNAFNGSVQPMSPISAQSSRLRLLPIALTRAFETRHPGALQRFPHQLRNRSFDRNIVGVAELLEAEIDVTRDLGLDCYACAHNTSGNDKSREAQ